MKRRCEICGCLVQKPMYPISLGVGYDLSACGGCREALRHIIATLQEEAKVGCG